FGITDVPTAVYSIAIRAEGFGLALKGLPYQSAGDSSFGVYLKESVGGLRLVLKPSAKSSERTWAEPPRARPTGKGPKGEPATEQTGVQLAGRILRNGKPVAGMNIRVIGNRPLKIS